MTKKKYQRYSAEFKRHALKRASEDRASQIPAAWSFSFKTCELYGRSW